MLRVLGWIAVDLVLIGLGVLLAPLNAAFFIWNFPEVVKKAIHEAGRK